MTLESLALQGRQATFNSLAASIISRIPELRKDAIKESFSGNSTDSHQLEVIANVHGIEFINDSHACTVNSTWFSLESMTRPVIWITGGMDEATDFSSLLQQVSKNVRIIIYIGKDPAQILAAFDSLEVPLIRARNMEEAVNLGYRLGRKGDTVLLSPACPSFDMYENYEERGRIFKEYVKNL
jgi:UDP-N-acetylmuramoylalanine--D-glutamate ligase